MSNFEDEVKVEVEASVEVTPDAETPLEVVDASTAEEEVPTVEENEVVADTVEVEVMAEEQPATEERVAYQPYPVDGRPE